MLLIEVYFLIFVYADTVESLDISELGRLLQLVLGCAVNCEDKQGKHIPMPSGMYYYVNQ